jgi:hypothetical protein
MKKNKQRNELSIFEELRLKPSKNEIWSSEDPPESSPREEDLKELNILCKVGKDNNPISWWKKRPNGEFMQVNEFGEVIFSGDKRYEKTIPKSENLKKLKTTVKIYRDKHITDLVSWWIKDENNNLIQVNLKEEDVGVEMKIKSWLRNKAIDVVSLEIRSMKKKAYEYSKEELMNMIEKEENKLIKKGGWKAVRVAALSTLGLSWLPFI